MTDDMKQKYNEIVDYVSKTVLKNYPTWKKEGFIKPFDRDYWLKLYAGKALEGLCANPNITQYSDLNDRESSDNEDIIEFAKFRAQLLVDKMFKDES